MIKLLVPETDDKITRENFRRLERYLKENNPLFGFKHIEVVLNDPVTSYRVHHGLGYIPVDVLRTRLTGTGDLVLNYSEFDSQTLSITTTGPVRFRAFVGTYANSEPGNEPS